MIRLQKLLAEAGLASRRTVEEWIRAGRVTVAGRVARLGDRAGPGDDVRLDGRPIPRPTPGNAPQVHEVLLYYKPTGEVTTRSDPAGRPTVFDRLPPPRAGRWISVGRLDVNTSGLLLLTTDGALAHRLMHPSSEVEREYLVRVRGRPPARVLERLRREVELEDGPARFDRLVPSADPDSGPKPGASVPGSAGGSGAQLDRGPGQNRPAGTRQDLPGHSSFRVVLHEGRNREVRRLWSAVGFEVSRLLRIRYGPAELPRDLRPGQARPAGAELVGLLRGWAIRSRGSGEPPG
ncbi:MAG: rRNA pseudouridine synthase [Proteobacteria bacterium]|nr:rRNA pseudouridine synthase [Pseudomonadota bacterium]